VQLSKIIVVARADFISDTVRKAWRTGGVDLLGPYCGADLPVSLPADLAGVLLDVRQDASTLFDLSERLMEENLPFLFVVDNQGPKSSLSPFVVDGEPGNRSAIYEALSRVGHEQSLQ
jgi:hypothetical protein